MSDSIYYESAAKLVSAKGYLTGKSEAEIVQAFATLAVAHEARTANLIAYLALIVGTEEGKKVELEILERLYA